MTERGSTMRHTVEPQEHASYGYWITVDRLLPQNAYRQVLRYRSATLYGDGNPLAVIDSEMPNIQRRLGLWTPGEPLPTPSGDTKSCKKPAPKLQAMIALKIVCSGQTNFDPVVLD